MINAAEKLRDIRTELYSLYLATDVRWQLFLVGSCKLL